jgi:hypothetical protein
MGVERMLHSKKASNLFHDRLAQSNDLVLKGLLFYIEPIIGLEAICRKLSEFHAQGGDIWAIP